MQRYIDSKIQQRPGTRLFISIGAHASIENISRV